MKLYKFYKDDCIPCRNLSRILETIDEVEIIPIDVKTIEGKELAFNHEISSVPVLMKENGDKLIGLKSKKDIVDFIGG